MLDVFFIVRSFPLFVLIGSALGYVVSKNNLWLIGATGVIIGMAIMDVVFCVFKSDDENALKDAKGKVAKSVAILIYYGSMMLIIGAAFYKSGNVEEKIDGKAVMNIQNSQVIITGHVPSKEIK